MGQIGIFIRVIQMVFLIVLIKSEIPFESDFHFIILIHKIRTAIILVVSCSVGLIKLLLNVSIAYDFKV